MALIFAVHPIETQAVTYIAQRLESMAGMFFLGSFYFYIKYRENKKMIFGILSILFILFGGRSKEIVVTFGGIILAYEIIFLKFKEFKKRDLLVMTLLILVSLIPFFVRFYEAFHTETGVLQTFDLRQAQEESMSRWDYFRTQINVVRTYLRLMLLPVGQCLDYVYPLKKNMDLETWATLFMHLGLIGVAIYNYNKNVFYSFGILWFYMILLPTSSIIPIEDVIYEHRLYLPSVGFIIMFVGTIYYIYERYIKNVKKNNI